MSGTSSQTTSLQSTNPYFVRYKFTDNKLTKYKPLFCQVQVHRQQAYKVQTLILAGTSSQTTSLQSTNPYFVRYKFIDNKLTKYKPLFCQVQVHRQQAYKVQTLILAGTSSQTTSSQSTNPYFGWYKFIDNKLTKYKPLFCQVQVHRQQAYKVQTLILAGTSSQTTSLQSTNPYFGWYNFTDNKLTKYKPLFCQVQVHRQQAYKVQTLILSGTSSQTTSLQSTNPYFGWYKFTDNKLTKYKPLFWLVQVHRQQAYKVQTLILSGTSSQTTSLQSTNPYFGWYKFTDNKLTKYKPLFWLVQVHRQQAYKVQTLILSGTSS